MKFNQKVHHYLWLICFLLGMKFESALAQSIKLCSADFDSIAIQTGMKASLEKIMYQKVDVLSARLTTGEKNCFPHSMPPPFCKDNGWAKQFSEEVARLDKENERQIHEASAYLERFSAELANSLQNDIRSQIAVVAAQHGCTTVLDTKAIRYGGDEITRQAIDQIRYHPSICDRWHLPLTPQQRAIFFFLPITPRASIFFR